MSNKFVLEDLESGRLFVAPGKWSNFEELAKKFTNLPSARVTCRKLGLRCKIFELVRTIEPHFRG